MLEHLILKAIGLLKSLPQKSERIPFKGGGWAKREGCPHSCEKRQKGASGRSECGERQRLSRTHARASDFVVAVARVGASSPRVLQIQGVSSSPSLGWATAQVPPGVLGRFQGLRDHPQSSGQARKLATALGVALTPARWTWKQNKRPPLVCVPKDMCLFFLWQRRWPAVGAGCLCWPDPPRHTQDTHAAVHETLRMPPCESSVSKTHLPCLSRSSVLESFLSLCLSLRIWFF